jgi:C1A family cysteine protease
MPMRGSYGAKPKPFDELDFHYSRLGSPALLPKSGKIDRQSKIILDQNEEGSCVINTEAEVIEYLVRLLCGIPDFYLSRSFAYRETRLAQHDLHSDDGCDPRTALNALRKHGAPPETDWPYDGLPPDSSKYFAATPTRTVYKEAHKLTGIEYINLGQTGGLLNDIRDCIANRKLPGMLSIAVWSSFEGEAAASNGKIPVPNSRTEQLLGYHEMSFWEYDDGARLLKCLNHWRADWGDGGFCYLPYDYVSNLQLTTDATAVTKAKLLQ